jgi:hypothetical protein
VTARSLQVPVVQAEVPTEVGLAILGVELAEEKDHPKGLTRVILEALSMYENDIDDSLV